MAEIKVEGLEEFKALMSRFADRMRNELASNLAESWAPDVERSFLHFLPVRTGELKRNFRVDVDEDTLLLSSTEYFVYLVTGTRPHDIFPRRARALRFVTESGEVVYAMHVRHPGFPPQPFFPRAMRESMRTLPEHAGEVLIELFRRSE